jgi:transcriptional regulator with XRE-family HTH domain
MVEVSAAHQVGSRVRQLRRQQQMTLDALAARSGVSRAMLSKVERGEKQPSLVTAVKIADGLDVTLSRLMSPEEQRAVVLIPRAQRREMVDPETGLVRQHLFPGVPSRRLEFVRAVLPAGGSSGDFLPHRPGVEQYMLIEQGRMRATLDRAEYVLEEGDALYFSADRQHRFDNIGDGECHYYVVLSFGDAAG